MPDVHTKSWPDLAIELYDKLTGRGAEITYQFDDFEVMVPSDTNDSAQFGRWKVSGGVKISTRDRSANA